MSAAKDLAPRLTITEAVRVYEECARDIREAFAMIAAAEKRLTETFAGADYRSISVSDYSGRVRFDDPADTLKKVRHEVWDALIDRLEVRRMMSVARAEELRKQIDRRELPEISLRSVRDLVDSFQQNLGTMLEEAVEEVFNWLRPRGSRYKTNSELEVPRKVVLSRIVETWDLITTSWRVNYRCEAELTALENVFTALDGKGQITKTHYSAISTAIRAPGFDGAGETPYFRFRCFKNGNMHLEFRRLDLLARFNQIAGGRRLRPANEG